MTKPSTVTEVPRSARVGLTLPLVSIVVVCYNHADFLRVCLDAVVAQTYPRLQLVVVDNASTDNSREVIERFAADLPALRADIALVPVFCADNGHEVGAMLAGFPHTRGNYVAFIDGDDFMLPGCIETHVKAHLVSRIPVGLTSVDMYQSNGDDIVIGTGPLHARFVMSKRGRAADLCRMANLDAFVFPAGADAAPLGPDDLHYVPPAMANEWVWSPSTGLCYRREAVAFMLQDPPKLRAGSDNYLVRGICALTGGIAIDRPLAVYRLHGNNLFTKHPALANLHPFDTAQRGALDVDVMGAIIACYRARIGDLARTLEEPDLFVKAIDHFAGIAPGLAARTPWSSFTLGFLQENRDELIAAFGRWRWRGWVARRLRPRDFPRLLGNGRLSGASEARPRNP